jgi:hypothetical protein
VPPGAYRVLHGLESGLVPRIGVGGGAQSPQPQQVMKLAVVLWPPGTCHGSVVLGQELLVEWAGQDAQDLDRIVWVVVVRRLCRHATIFPQRADIVSERHPRMSASGQACWAAGWRSAPRPGSRRNPPRVAATPHDGLARPGAGIPGAGTALAPIRRGL